MDPFRRTLDENTGLHNALDSVKAENKRLRTMLEEFAKVASPIAQNLVFHSCGHHPASTGLYEMVNMVHSHIGKPGLIPDPALAKKPGAQGA